MRPASTTIVAITSAFACAGCFFDGELKHDYGTVPEPLADGWEIGTPEQAGLSAEALAGIHSELMREDRHLATLGMLIAVDGKLVWETYLHTPEDRDRFHHVQSSTKSVTSLVLGIARDQGVFGSLDQTLDTVFPEELKGLEPIKGTISLRNLFTMVSGIDFDNGDFAYDITVDQPRNLVRYILEKPLYADPGARYYYRDADPQLAGLAFQRLSGKTELEFAREHLFAPLGITDERFYWEIEPDGSTMAAHGLHLMPRDFLKIGQLALDGCVWRGQRIVSEEWCRMSMSPQVASTTNARDGSPYQYGFYWWIVKDVGFTTWGHGGQFALVVPAKRMVILQFARPDGELHGSHLNDFLELVDPLLH